MEQTGKKKINMKKLLQRIFLILVAIFVVRYFYRNFDDIKDLDLSISPLPFIVSIVCFSIYKVAEASLWHYITVINHCAIGYKKAVKTYLFSILGKYIPGKVFMLLARIPVYREEGVSADKVTVCFLLENGCTVLGAALLFLVSIFFFPVEELSQYKWTAILLIAVFFVCIHPKILNFFLGLLEKITKKKIMHIPMTYPQILKVVLLFFTNWLVHGFAFYMLVCSIYPLPFSQCLYVAGLYGLSCIIGILAIFSPSGIGVREGILVLGLQVLMDTNYCMIISIVARLWSEIIELVLIGGWFLIDRLVNGKNAENSILVDKKDLNAKDNTSEKTE